jgi:DNA-binding XRE family transcriptional regulator
LKAKKITFKSKTQKHYKMKNLAKKSKPGTKSLAELEDKYFGKKGSSKREQYEKQVNIEIIGELLKQYRENMHFTQEQLAKKMGMDKTYISKIENNVKTQRIDTLVSFLKALQGHLFIRIATDGGYKEVELV